MEERKKDANALFVEWWEGRSEERRRGSPKSLREEEKSGFRWGGREAAADVKRAARERETRAMAAERRGEGREEVGIEKDEEEC